MNREVAILRDVITKLTPMLAGMGLRVTQRGAQAYVMYKKDGSGAVDYVNIPHVPDSAEPSLVLAIQGFIDHEVGHILFTDVKSLLDCKKKGAALAKKRGWPEEKGVSYLDQIDNIVEDPYVEREMTKRFPGSLWNLDRLYTVFLEKTTIPALESVARTGGSKQTENEMGILMVPVIRAFAGQKIFQNYLDNTGGWNHPLIKAFTDRVPAKLRARIATAKDSWAVLEIAEELFEILYPVPPPPPPSPPPAPPSDEKSDEPKKGDDDKSDKPKDESEPEPKKEEGEPGKDEKNEGEGAAADKPESDDGEKEADDKGDKDDAPSDDLDGELGEASEKDADLKDAGDEADEPGEDDDDSDTEGDGADGERGDDAETGGGKGKDSDGDEPDDGAEGGSGEGELIEVGAGKEAEVERSPFEEIEIDLKDKDLSKAVAAIITEAATEEAADAPWLVYSTEYDKIEPLKVPEDQYEPAWLAKLNERTRHMIAPMQKDIERMMASRSQVIKVPGFRSGKLHGGSLHKLKTGDDRVFRRVQEGISKETAVTLLIDNSGSMMGSCMQVAMAAGYAMSQTLERVGIKHEVIGFTTCGYEGDRHALSDYTKMLHEEQVRIGRRFSRSEPLFMPIYKGFDERLTPTAKARFAYAFGVRRGFLLQNIDGECLGVAGDRIARQREPRKVIIVLSDGAPASTTSDRCQLEADLRRRIKDLAARKIETIGIGIEDDNVKRFYPKYVVLEDLNKLPGTVIGELRRILLSN